jgi:SAM-dependent methyltransferase
LQAKYLADIPVGTLLDIGCANGDWIHLMQEKGWKVEGLEPSQNAVNLYNLKIRNAMIEEAVYPSESFDVITAWAVFEHLHDPMLALRRIHGWLKPGGKLILVVTNICSIASRWAYQEDIPRHLYVFSESTLGRYADEVGMEMVDVHHDTQMFGGSGRGVIRVRLFERLGIPRLNYFRAMKLPIQKRVKEYPFIALVGGLLSILERIFLTDWLVRQLRVSGIIVVSMKKPFINSSAILPDRAPIGSKELPGQ